MSLTSQEKPLCPSPSSDAAAASATFPSTTSATKASWNFCSASSIPCASALPAIVHCASGNRVGALFGLKAHLQDGLPAEAALETAHAVGITRMEPTLRQRLGLPPEKK